MIPFIGSSNTGNTLIPLMVKFRMVLLVGCSIYSKELQGNLLGAGNVSPTG